MVSFVIYPNCFFVDSIKGLIPLIVGGNQYLVLGFLNKVSNILLEFTAVTRYLIPLERGTEDVAHKPVYYHTFFE